VAGIHCDRKIYTNEDVEKYYWKDHAHYKSHGYGFGLVLLKITGTPLDLRNYKRPFLDFPDIGCFLTGIHRERICYEIASATMSYARAVLV
jgi:hypothetical protein